TDSVAEASCLRGSLVAACAEVIGQSKPITQREGVLKRGVGLSFGEIQLSVSDVSNPGAGIDVAAVEGAFRTWIRESTAAFNRAIDDVRANGSSSMGRDVTEEVIYILERYARAAQGTVAPPRAVFREIEQGFWRVKTSP